MYLNGSIAVFFCKLNIKIVWQSVSIITYTHDSVITSSYNVQINPTVMEIISQVSGKPFIIILRDQAPLTHCHSLFLNS